MRICTSFAMVRFLKPRSCMRWMKSGVILKMRIWISSSRIGLIAEGTNLFHFVGVDSLDFEADELVGVGLFVAHRDEAPGVGGIDFEDAQGNEVVDGDAADLGLLQRAGIVGCDIEEGVGLEFFGIEAGETECGHAVDEGGIGGEDGVAAKFVIVDGASAGKRAGFSG